MSLPEDIVRIEGARVAEGDTEYTTCPSCDRAGKLAITKENGAILYYCFRDSCGFKGKILDGGSLPWMELANNKPEGSYKPRPKYLSVIETLGEEDLDYFRDRFGLDTSSSWEYISKDIDNPCYVFRLVDRYGKKSGTVVRRHAWKGDIQPPMDMTTAGAKTLTYSEVTDSLLGIYGDFSPETVVIVEDCLSAIRAAQDLNPNYYEFNGESVCAIALLGTRLNDRQVAEIAALGAKEHIVALDWDARQQGIELVKRWRYCLPNMRAAMLPMDIKDMPPGDVPEYIKVGL